MTENLPLAETKTSLADENIVLSVRGLSKKFCRDLKSSLFYGVRDIAKELLGISSPENKLRDREFWALKNVNLTLKRGQALGLIGTNGAGKTTLLRIISGLIKPDGGVVEIRGQIAPLIALGAGFNPILTGRENIWANMSILGQSKKEIEQKFDEVVEFAEIGDAIDAPVQSYSSGMQARLGFACAIHTEPDILLVDEVLAVGDMRFRAKCHRRLHELKEKGISIVLVSHNSQSILNVCEYSVYLSKGQVVDSGETYQIMNEYETDLFLSKKQDNDSEGFMQLPPKPEGKSLGLDITYICFRDRSQKIIPSLDSGSEVSICVGYKAQKTIEESTLLIDIKKLAGESPTRLLLSNFNDNQRLKVLPGEHEFRVNFPYLGLLPGMYTLRVALRKDALYTYDFVETFRFKVLGEGINHSCSFYQPRSWQVVAESSFEKNNISGA